MLAVPLAVTVLLYAASQAAAWGIQRASVGYRTGSQLEVVQYRSWDSRPANAGTPTPSAAGNSLVPAYAGALATLPGPAAPPTPTRRPYVPPAQAVVAAVESHAPAPADMAPVNPPPEQPQPAAACTDNCQADGGDKGHKDDGDKGHDGDGKDHEDGGEHGDD
jgi:hypothetical protein